MAATLIWDEGAPPTEQGASAASATGLLPSGPLVLHMGLRRSLAAGVQGQELMAAWNGARWGGAGSFGLSLGEAGTPPSGDFFDLLMAAVEHRSAVLSSTRTVALASAPNRTHLTGMTLRQELADWLRTPAGRQCELPRLTAPTLKPVDEALVAELATFVHEELASGNATMARIVAPLWQPGPADDRLDRVLQTLRSGGWCDPLDHLVPTLLVRLPFSHRCSRTALGVICTGERIDYGWPEHPSRSIRLTRHPDGRMSHKGWSQNVVRSYAPGPDNFLEAAFRIPPGELHQWLPGVRDELATIMASHRTLMNLRLALAERNYPCDQEMLLRRCLINGQLTPAGEQLLHPERPQRPVTVGDMERWFQPTTSVHARSPAAVAAAGISVVDAYRLASPLRPTLAGNVLMGLPPDQYLRWHQDEALTLLEEMFPELVYACQTASALRKYLRISSVTYRTCVPAHVHERARRFKAEAAAAERVNLPPSLHRPTSAQP
ncbi:hypothetical protein [Roseateles terrae]|uniref:Uncharacterized protein n=1 Tax=Roseateles terrae TaxID=431060 RepID=A0ABR6GQM8_9BURK|nr:hypothetical protein [Roseateles terrae]MBB3194364.1 hypothetical protein [Roseateles terrae]OWQ88198.1 hypothetical protein CDN98_08710 [Roseateles terrae]